MTENNYDYVGRKKHRDIVGRSNESAWETAATSRTHILRLLPGNESERRGIVCVIGVGDGTSIDLSSLLKRFHEVHLVDLDADAIGKAIQAQALEGRHRIFPHQIDMTGARHLLDRYKTEPSAELFDEFVKIASAGPANTGLPKFDVVLSLFQIPAITMHAVDCLGQDQKRIANTIVGLRHHHIGTLLDHLTDNGTAVMVIDIVGSGTLPALAQAPGNLPELLDVALKGSNFFPGALPVSVNHAVDHYSDRLSDSSVSRTWIRSTPKQAYASMAWRLVNKPKKPDTEKV